jgi:hypothetical protein
MLGPPTAPSLVVAIMAFRMANAQWLVCNKRRLLYDESRKRMELIMLELVTRWLCDVQVRFSLVCSMYTQYTPSRFFAFAVRLVHGAAELIRRTLWPRLHTVASTWSTIEAMETANESRHSPRPL